MSATAVAPTSGARTWTRATVAALIAFAILVLVAMSFVLGRATNTSTTHRAPVVAPAAAVVQTISESCHVNRPC